MKKLFALLLTLAMLLSMAACNSDPDKDYDKESDKEKDDGLVTVWLLASETEYKADGSRGYSKITYSYTDKGLIQSMEQDHGPREEVWNEEDFIYEFIYNPFDDTLDTKYEYFYNDHGDLLYYTWDRYYYDEEGNVTDTQHWGECEDNNIIYHYNEAGEIESIDWYPVKAEGGHGDEVNYIEHCEYDEAGNLIEVWGENLNNDTKKWVWDYRYDEAGRLTASAKRNLDAGRFYWYEYNEEGQLSRMRWTFSLSQLPLDDKHVSKSDEAAEGNATTDLVDNCSEVRFEYDAKGNLTARKFYRGGLLTRTDTVTWQDGKVSALTYNLGETDDDEDYIEESKYVFVDDEKDADPSATTLVRDKNGNIVKMIHPSGDYLEMEYKKFRLTEEEAQKCRMAQYAYNTVDPAGYARSGSYHIRYTPGAAFELYRPMLKNAFYEVDVLKD